MEGVLILLVLWVIATTYGDKYRYDYTYDAGSQGWFKVHIQPATWNEARLRCMVEGAILASPTDVKIRESLVSRIKKLKNEESIYTGINSRFYRGHYYSIDGIPLNRMKLSWMPNEPNNYQNDENCLVLTKTGCVADMNCKEVFPFICYKSGPENVALNECGTTDPEYRLFSKTGSCYKFHYRARNWTRAYMTCAGEGGYIAIPNNEEEARHLADMFQENWNRAAVTTLYKETMYLGFINERHDDYWTTILGDPLEDGYAVWEKNKPDGTGNNPYCGTMSLNAKLDDMLCVMALIYICEKDPKSLL